MRRPANSDLPFRIVAAIAALCLVGCVGRLSSKPGVYDASHEAIELPKRTFDITYVKPAVPRPTPTLVVFATGDAGWMGASREVFEHMAQQGYYLAGFDSRKAIAPNRDTGEKMSIADAGVELETMFAHAKRALGLPENTREIVVGDSRGATMVIFAAAERHMKGHVAGGIAIALTREADYLHAPPPAERDPAIQVDDKGRIQVYPVLQRLESIPIAVIQSTHDRYVPSAESRRLMGPDTPTLRLYEVKARNHGFDGGRDQLLHDLDDALKWIEG
jgi:type IV secretory pathway VirJ component